MAKSHKIIFLTLGSIKEKAKTQGKKASVRIASLRILERKMNLE
jgi:hypothetical protein